MAAAVGILAWSGQPVMLSLAFVFLILLTAQTTRASAYAVALSYYAGSSWSLVPGAHAFFGPDSTLLESVTLWVTASALMAAPWGLFHFRSGLAWLYSVPLGLLAITIPPLGIIGWASPLTGAGVLFPGTGWLGIIAFVCLPGIMIRYPRLDTSAAGMLIVVANVAHRTDPSPPRGWEAVDTVFGRSEFEIPDPIHEFQKAQWLQQRSLNSHGTVVIFPETVIPRWNAATEIFWKPTLNQLVNSGKTIVLGATVRGLASGPVNKIIIRGASGPGSFSQRIPPQSQCGGHLLVQHFRCDLPVSVRFGWLANDPPFWCATSCSSPGRC